MPPKSTNFRYWLCARTVGLQGSDPKTELIAALEHGLHVGRQDRCSSVVSPDDLCRSLICLHRLSGSSAFSSGREDLRCRRLMLVSCHLCDVITWWEQKLSALKIVVLSGRLRIAVL
ncbi:uncharacterized protein TNCV_52361 [Trichonephila clavipes]|nr:uncharacterized protein TNCV_52361 [Trichonephila clavipes]